jgi:putative transposase
MKDFQSLSHTVWDCKYHLVWIPKCRKKVLYGQLKKYLGSVFHELAIQKESKVVEGHLMPDHVHRNVSTRMRHSLSEINV